MKSIFQAILFAAVIGVCGLTGCSDGSPSQESVGPENGGKETGRGDLLERIRSKGELVIATEGTWAPWTFHDAHDTLTGFDVEVMRMVAARLGVKAMFVESEWDGIFAGLDAKRWDVAANGVEVTEDRAEKYNFARPYAFIHTALIVRGDNETIKTFADLQGKRTANSLSSTYMILAESYGAESLGVDSLGETLEMVLAGRVDATLNADVSFFDYIKEHPEANLKIVALTSDAVGVAFPTRKDEDSSRLVVAIDKALDELWASGELGAVAQRFFNTDITRAKGI